MKIKFKKTPIFFLSILCVPFFAFGALYYLLIENNGGRALAGAISLFALIINLVILIVEQIILKKKINLKKVWIAEIVLILLIILFSIYFTD
jgi:hypothetical protein